MCSQAQHGEMDLCDSAQAGWQEETRLREQTHAGLREVNETQETCGSEIALFKENQELWW